MTLVSTDSKRLSWIIKDSQNTKDISCIIPKKTIVETLKIFDSEFDFYIKRQEKNKEKIESIAVVGQGVELYSRLISGSFPNFDSLLDKKPEVEPIVFDKEKLLKTMNKMNSICKRVKIEFFPNKLVFKSIEGINNSKGSATMENIPTHLDVELVTGLVNKHFLDFITNVKADKILMYMDDPNSPIYFDGTDFTEIIMPQIV